MPKVESSLTIREIVREPDNQVVRRPRPSPSSIPLPDRVNRNGDGNPNSTARTLRRCRNVQRNIQALRENWNALRSGSLRFCSTSSEFGVTRTQKQVSGCSVSGKSGQPQLVENQVNLQQSTIQGGPSSDTSHEKASKDVDKAWKMMDRAKTMQKNNPRTSILPQGRNHPSSGARAGTRKASSIHCNDQELRIQQSSKSSRMGKQHNYCSFNKDLDNYWPPKLEEENQSRLKCKEIQHIRVQASHKEGHGEPPLLRKVNSHEDGERDFAKEQHLVMSVGSTRSHGTFGSVPSSSRELDNKERLTKTFGNVNTRESEDAKDQIKSLVKLNLNILSKDKRLGIYIILFIFDIRIFVLDLNIYIHINFLYFFFLCMCKFKLG